MIFASPRWLLLLLLVPLAAGAYAWLATRDRDRLRALVAQPLWSRVVRRPAERWRWPRLVLLLLGVAGLIVALARPQWGIVREKVEREGVDVVLLLDTSASMATADVAPSRFFLARQALLQLISRLEGDRFALVAFEGEAYPLVPLTLDADALGLFLETAEPGIVPAPGTSVGVGLAKGLDAFVDKERRNKVMVLVSDGEDLEGEVAAAVRRAKEAGVVVHTVGVGTEAGQPVPETDASGRVVGYKRDEDGSPVVSRLNLQTLEAIARGTGGQTFRLTPQDTSLSRLADAIEGLEQKTLAREYSYRRKEQFQLPLALGLSCLGLALLLPLPSWRRAAAPTAAVARAAALALALAGLSRAAAAQVATPVPAAPAATARRGSPVDEVLLRPKRATSEGRGQYERGNHPQALSAFERAAAARPQDPAVRFNVADGLYKNGRYDEAAALYRSLAADPSSPVAAPSRYNLGNSLFQKQDYRGAVQAYRDTLRLTPGAQDARRNLELALRALREQEQQQQQKQQQEQQDQKKDQKQQKNQKPQQGQDQKRGQKKEQDQKERSRRRASRSRARNRRGRRRRRSVPSSASGRRPACRASARCSCSTRCSRTRRPSRRSCSRRSARSGRRARTGEGPRGIALAAGIPRAGSRIGRVHAALRGRRTARRGPGPRPADDHGRGERRAGGRPAAAARQPRHRRWPVPVDAGLDRQRPDVPVALVHVRAQAAHDRQRRDRRGEGGRPDGPRDHARGRGRQHPALRPEAPARPVRGRSVRGRVRRPVRRDASAAHADEPASRSCSWRRSPRAPGCGWASLS